MKKYLNIMLAAWAVLCLAFSCNKEIPAADNPLTPAEGQEEVIPSAADVVTISAKLTDVLTRVDFEPSYSEGKPTGMALTWAEGDVVRVYNHADRSQYDDFTLAEESIGLQDGTFTGTPDHLVGATSYDVEVSNGVIDYDHQIQPKDGVTTNLKYFASARNIEDYTDIVFTDISGILAITAKMPEGVAGEIKSVELISEDAFLSGLSETITIELEETGDEGDDGILHFFANLGAGDTESGPNTILVRFYAPDTEHTVYTRYIELDGTAVYSNKLNTININATQSDKHAGTTSCDGSTAEKAYLIGDKYQLLAMDDILSNAVGICHFKLIDDIDLLGVNWTSLNPVNGIYLDGNNMSISHLITPLFDDFYGKATQLQIVDATVDTEGATTPAGIFANSVTKTGCVISDVNIIGTGTNTCSISSNGYTGALIGMTGTNSNHEVDITISDVDVQKTSVTGKLAGGIVGFFNSRASLSNSHYKEGTVKSNSTYAGGLVAATFANYSSIISECSVESATITSSFNHLGGAVGYLRAGSLISKTTVGTSDANVSVTATETAACNTGGFVGRMDGGEIKDNCIAYITVTGVKTQIGGFVGYMTGGKVTGCKSYGEVKGPGTIGGFFGEVTGATEISGNESHCIVTATSTYVGGFAGRLAGSISCSNCKHVDGKVWSNLGGSSPCYLGGFVGYIGNTNEAFTGTISGCYANKTEVDGVKYNDNGSAESSGQYVGGFAGCIGSTLYSNNSGIVEKCGVYSSSKAGGQYTGGFAGASFAKIEQCRVNGTPTITGYANYIGGFIGKQSGHHVKFCYSNAKIRHNNKKYVGGLIGNPDDTFIQQCYSSGDITFTGSNTNNQSVIGGMIGKGTNNFSYSQLIRWNKSNNATIEGGETTVPANNYVKLNDTDNFEEVAATGNPNLDWSHDGSIWSYPTDGGLPSLVNVP